MPSVLRYVLILSWLHPQITRHFQKTTFKDCLRNLTKLLSQASV